MAELTGWIFETTEKTFEADVIERSSVVPVIVDFWAPWCEPCRQLTPLLEQFIKELAGRVVLAKVNIDESPDLAAAFGVQSIPQVFAIRDGQAVNRIQGLLPEEELRKWIESVLPSPAEEVFKRGQALEADDPAAAEACYREASQLAPDQDSIKLDLARVLLTLNRDDECRQVITELEGRGYLEPEAEKLKSQLDLRSAAASTGGVDEARQAAAVAPDDLALQLKLADTLAVAYQHEEALEICLTLVQRGEADITAEAKKTMLQIFDMLGPESELVSRYRRRLATALY
jgi:putative thioredoxin